MAKRRLGHGVSVDCDDETCGACMGRGLHGPRDAWCSIWRDHRVVERNGTANSRFVFRRLRVCKAAEVREPGDKEVSE